MYNDVTSRNASKQLRSLYVMAAHKNGDTQSFGIVSIFRFPATFWAMVIPSFRIPFHSIPSRSILSHPTLSHSIPLRPIPTHPIPFNSIPSYSIPSCPIQSNPIQSNLIIIEPQNLRLAIGSKESGKFLANSTRL